MNKIPAGYKKTEVGIIPEDWKLQTLSSLAEISTGKTPPTCNKNYYGNEYFFVSPADLGNGKWIKKTEKKLSQLGFNISKKFPPKSILFTCIGSTIGKVGMADRQLTSNQQINAVIPNDSFSSDFLFSFLEFFAFKIKKNASETAVPIINKTEFGNTIIVLPPTIEEQTAIAIALNDADALITQLEKLIAKKRLIKQGAMQQLLTGKKRLAGFDRHPDGRPKGHKQTALGSIPEDWEVSTIADICEVKSGKRLPLGKSLSEKETNYPYIRVADMYMGGISLSEIKFLPEDVFPYIKNYRIFVGDIFISVAGTLGIVGKIPKILDGANLTENADRLTNINCNRDYLLYVLASWLVQQTIEAEKTLGAQPKLALTRIRTFKIPLPPTKEEQTAIAQALSDMDAELDVLEARLDKYNQIKQGMMQTLLTGKVRLL